MPFDKAFAGLLDGATSVPPLGVELCFIKTGFNTASKPHVPAGNSSHNKSAD